MALQVLIVEMLLLLVRVNIVDVNLSFRLCVATVTWEHSQCEN
jgi:hypothetical protein